MRVAGWILAASMMIFAAPAEAQERLVVQYEPGTDLAERAELRAAADVQLVDRPGLPRLEVVAPKTGQVGSEVLPRLREEQDVRWAGKDIKVQLTADPSDPLFAQQWSLPLIQVNAGWAQALGAGQTVAVIDSGVQMTQVDLDSQIATNPAETGTDGNGNDKRSNGIDDDNDGYVDNWRGWDWVQDDNDPSDANGHGTHVAGIIAATHGDQGIAGMAPQAKILPLRALDAGGSGWMSDIASAISYAGSHGIRIANTSLGGTGGFPPLSAAISAYPDMLLFAAAGNGGGDVIGDDNDASPYYPCSYPQASIVCVGATTSSEQPASYSNYGATSVDLFAPGSGIYSSYYAAGNDTYWRSLSGTSMATPHVAGAAALLWSWKPGASTSAIRKALLEGSITLAILQTKAASGGRLNIAGSFGHPDMLVAPAEPQPAPQPSQQPQPQPAPVTNPQPAPQPQPPPAQGPTLVLSPIKLKKVSCTRHKSCSTKVSSQVNVKAELGLVLRRKICKSASGKRRCWSKVAYQATWSANGRLERTIPRKSIVPGQSYTVTLTATVLSQQKQRQKSFRS